MMKLRLARSGFLIDINRIPGLAYIQRGRLIPEDSAG